MIHHAHLTDTDVRRLLRSGDIAWAGNRRLRIYGTLRCWSGKRMKRANRVFFRSEADAIAAGFRPCGHCMRGATSARKPV
ncbi:MAG: Ada metal-binding domain-containing protein [Rhodothermales bacterium]